MAPRGIWHLTEQRGPFARAPSQHGAPSSRRCCKEVLGGERALCVCHSGEMLCQAVTSSCLVLSTLQSTHRAFCIVHHLWVSGSPLHPKDATTATALFLSPLIVGCRGTVVAVTAKSQGSGCPGTVPIVQRQQGVVVQQSEQMCWVQGLAEPALGQEVPWLPGCRELWVWGLHWGCFGGCVGSGLWAVFGLVWGLCWRCSLCPPGSPQRDACCAVSWISLAKASLKVTMWSRAVSRKVSCLCLSFP